MNQTEARRTIGQILACRAPRSANQLDLDRFPVANYIVFAEDLEPSFEASHERIQNTRELLRDRKSVETLFMMDEEGGRVTQISNFFPSAPSPRAVSESLKPEQARSIYAHVSAYLRNLGIDINLFPCLDVNTEPLNPIIGTRAFGENFGQVSAFARAAIEASQDHVACVGKHFPGHGMTSVDSHLELPIIETARTTLESVHISPFKEAIGCGIEGMMISHCVYSSFQRDSLPASLSGQVINDLLRDALGYGGLVLTDSLDMRAITENLGPERVAPLAVEAGCDLLLYTEFSRRFETAFETLVDMLLRDELDEQRLRDSIARRHKLLERCTARDESHPATLGDSYMALRDRIMDQSIKVKDSRGILPLRCDEAILISTSLRIIEKLRSYVPSMTIADDHRGVNGKVLVLWMMEPLRLNQSFEELRSLIRLSNTAILVTTYDALVKHLADCDVTVVSRDSGPNAEDAIIRKVFASNQ